MHLSPVLMMDLITGVRVVAAPPAPRFAKRQQI